MKGHGSLSRGFITAVMALTLSDLAVAQSPGQPITIGDNDSIFIDGKTFTITPGKAKGDALQRIGRSGAQPLGPGAVIFRSNQQLYIMDASRAVRSAGADDQPGRVGPDGWRPNRIRIQYDPPKKEEKFYDEKQKLYEMIMQHHVLETVQKIFSPFRFPTDVLVKTTGCDGKVNAWYSRDDNQVPTVTLCDELLMEILRDQPKETTPAGVTPDDAIRGQVFVWTAHEMGHAVYDLYQVPLFGRSEDAADQFAAYVMLQFGKDQARRLVGGAAYFVKYLNVDFQKDSKIENKLDEYSAVHGFPEQRFYNLLCLAYGADPELFADVVEKGYLPKSRAGNCDREYAAYKQAFQMEISPHIDRQMARAVLDTSWLPPQKSPQPVAK